MSQSAAKQAATITAATQARAAVKPHSAQPGIDQNGNHKPHPIASPHFKFAKSKTADRPKKSDTILSTQDPAGPATNQVHLRIDQQHSGPAPTHLPRSVIESFVGWSEVTTSALESGNPTGVLSYKNESTHASGKLQARVPTDETITQQDFIADCPIPESAIRNSGPGEIRFLTSRDPFGQAIRKTQSPIGEITTSTSDESSNSKQAMARLVLNPVEGTAVKRLGKGRRIPATRESAAPEPQTSVKSSHTEIADREKPAGSQFQIESIPLFPEPAWPFVSDLLLGAGWPFVSRLAEGMDKILAGRSSRILISGVQRAVGSTTLALTLGRWAAANNRKVLVVDADLQSAGLTRIIGRDPARSWPAVTRGKDFVTTGIVRSSRTGIAFATTGKIRNRQLWPPFALNRLGELLDSIEGLFDLVLIDAGPVNQIVAELTDCKCLTGCAMVISTGSASEEPMIQGSHQRLGQLGAERILSARNFSSTPLKRPA